jgi:hypothetical protein
MKVRTKCTGEGCPKKMECERYTSEKGLMIQRWYMNTPFIYENGKFECQKIINNKEE